MKALDETKKGAWANAADAPFFSQSTLFIKYFQFFHAFHIHRFSHLANGF